MTSVNKFLLLPCRSYNGHSLPASFENLKDEISDFEVNNDDVLVSGYPKSGTSWCQELVWLIANDLNYEKAKAHIGSRFFLLERNAIFTDVVKFNKENELSNIHDKFDHIPDQLNILNNLPSPRFIKTHLPWSLLPKQIQTGQKVPKIIHIMRDPREVLISNYHFLTTFMPCYRGSLVDFVDLYITGRVLCGGYFNTVLSYWQRRNKLNVLLIIYEEMHADLEGVIKKISTFLSKTYSTNQHKELIHHLNFDQMKNNEAVNIRNHFNDSGVDFMRSSSIDSYKRLLAPEIIKKLDDWIAENTKGTGLPY